MSGVAGLKAALEFGIALFVRLRESDLDHYFGSEEGLYALLQVVCQIC